MHSNYAVCAVPFLATTLMLAFLTMPGFGQDPKLENKGTERAVTGYVRDAACLMRHPDVLKPSNECAVMCARAGSPLVLATTNGELYLPISGSIPDQSQRETLIPLVGKYVRVTGHVFERSGMRAIAIEHIETASERNQ